MQLSLRRAWPAVVVALLVAAGAVRAVAHNRGQAAAAACPAGYALASHEADGGHDADAGSASTTCLNTKHPESLIELIRRQEALETVRSAPYDTVAPGAFANAVSQSKTLPKASKSTGTSGTWSIYGKGPLIVNDPRYSRVNGLGLVNNEGRVDSIKYDPVNNRMFIAKGTGGIWMSTDAGDSWKSIGDGLPSQIVGAVGWTSANGGTVVAVSGDPTYGSGGYTGFGAFYSTDLGTTWQKATGVPDGALGFAIETDPSAPNKVIEYATRAGRRAIEQLAPAEARRWFERGLEMLPQGRVGTDTDRHMRCELLIGLGDLSEEISLSRSLRGRLDHDCAPGQ